MKGSFCLRRLVWRGVVYHRRAYLLVLATCGIASAVITGALLVGDSVTGSLADRLKERLGTIDHAVVSGTFFSGTLADRTAALSRVRRSVAAILLSGTAVHAETRRRAGAVQVVGVPPAFWSLWKEADLPRGVRALDLEKRTAVINASLARSLELQEGESILVHFEKAGDVPAEYAFGRRAEMVPPLRLEVAEVLPDRGPAIFGLDRTLRVPRNVFVPIGVLARALKKEGLANVLLLSSEQPDGSEGEGPGGEDALAESILGAWELEDLGLRLRADAERGYVALESRELLLTPGVAHAVEEAFKAKGEIERQEVLTYLANTLAAGAREVPYSTVSAVGPWVGGGGSAARKRKQGVVSSRRIPPGGILLNGWAAGDLEARPGDKVRLAYYAVGDRHEIVEREAFFRLESVVPLEGEARDSGWTPEYPGISDAESLRDWDPPFPIDFKRLRERDEDYWDAYRATPKAFVSLEDGLRLWNSRFGSLTSVRFRSKGKRSVDELARVVRATLRQAIDPRVAGVRLEPVERDGQEAAKGATDFSGLFVALSFFLIASALLLLAMVFRLSAERRAAELGALAAVGYPRRALVRLLVAEGGVAVVCGTALGVAGGVGYGALLIWGLRTVWQGAVHMPFLSLHVGGFSLLIGGASTALLSVLATQRVARRLGRREPLQLLARQGALELAAAGAGRRGWGNLWLAVCAAAGAALLLAAGSAAALFSPQVAFFGAGTLLLVAGLALVNHLLRGPPRAWKRGRGLAALARVGVGYAGRAPGRSLLTVALMASASFVIVTVAASRAGSAGAAGKPSRNSGDGGLSLAARSAVPLTASLSSEAGREALNVTPETSRLLDACSVFAFRVRPGDDISCLNLYRPRSPRLLGAPQAFLDRGGFAWAGSLAATDAERRNPWMLLEKTFSDGAVPVVGDASTVTWILHSALGEDVEVTGDDGRPLKLRIVGLLAHSIFQGELLLSPTRFLEKFPSISGERFFLLDTPAGKADRVSAALEADLTDLGFDVESTAEILASYREVTNTYLETFQLLGGLGLLLGTFGLGAVLARHMNDRRGELALLRAVGYSGGALTVMVLAETVFLLVAGIATGALAALASLWPTVAAAGGNMSWKGVAVSLGAMLLVGLLSGLVALRQALTAPVIPALRAE